MSQHMASSSPPPRQKPWIAATNGVCAASIPRAELLDPARRPAVLARRLAQDGNSEMSAPATNARSPAPFSTIARTPSSASSATSSASSSSRSGPESAFTGAWSIVTTATMPSRSLEMNSATTPSPPAASRTARGAPSCETCRRRSSGSPRRTRSGPGATTSRSAARGTRAAPRPSPTAPSRSTQTASGRSAHFSSGTAMTAASATAGCPMSAFSSATVEIHSPPDHEVLRAVPDLDVPVRLDGHDVAGLEPAVVRPAVGALGRLVVRGRNQTPRTSSSPIVSPSQGTSPSAPRARISKNAAGMPCFAR